MQIKVVAEDIARLPVDAIIVNLFEGMEQPGGATAAVDSAFNGNISSLIKQGEIKGKLNESTIIHTLGQIPPARVVVMGLGKREGLTTERIRGIMGEACRLLRRSGARHVATIVHGTGAGGLDAQKAAQAIVEGSLLGLYSFEKYKTSTPEYKEISELLLVHPDKALVPILERGCQRGQEIAEAANMARDWTNEPANFMTPSALADIARQVAEEEKLECQVLERTQMQELGMGALLGVAQGSSQPPKLVTLRYRGNPQIDRTIGLIGKGITFDSGGISLKPADGMAEMKDDMAGAAAAIATMRAISRLKPKVNVSAVIPATENMPGGSALKPGDTVKAMNGKTIEIVSTDAEGRLILADAICYAKRQGLSPIIDAATLTGACRVALGAHCSGLFSNDQQLADKLKSCGEETGERLWQMPMYEEYKEQNKSEIADIKNSGSRYGGAITAAQFLATFVEDTPWVHIDIAGTATLDKPRSYLGKGATGVPMRTWVEFVSSQEGLEGR